MDDQGLDSRFDKLMEKQNYILDTLRAGEQRSKGKDGWDKFGSISSFLSGVVIGLLALCFTYTYNLQQDKNRKHELHLKAFDSATSLVRSDMPKEARMKLALIVAQDTPYATSLAELLVVASQVADNPSAPPAQKVAADKALATSPVFQVVPDIGGSERGRQALLAAVRELEAGAREIGGANRGPSIEKYQRVAGLPKGSPWSVAFVMWCYSEVTGGLPFKPTGFGPDLLQQFRDKGWLSSSEKYEPQPGDVVWRSTSDGGSRLLGIVQRSDGTTLYVIQGNVGEDMVAARAYSSTKGFIFGHVP